MQHPFTPDGSGRDERPDAVERDESALREERADLVRGVLARRRRGDVERVDAAEPERAGPIVGAGPEGRGGERPDAAAPAPGAAADARDDARDDVSAEAPLDDPRADGAAIAPAAGEHRVPAVIVSPQPPADTSVHAALPHALAQLRAWYDIDRRARHELRLAQEGLDARRADRLDPAGDLERALRAEGGADFVRRLIDDVVRPDDLLASGFGLGDLADRIPARLTARTRRLLRLGAFAGPGVPWAAVPLARRIAGALFGHEVTADDRLRDALGRADDRGAIARVRPLADPVLGERGASALLERVLGLVRDPAVAEVELTVGDLDPAANEWDFEGSADRAAGRLAGVLLESAHAPRPTAVVLRATGSRDLELAIETFMRGLDVDGLEQVRATIAIPADVPEASTLLRRLAGWAHLRREDGGAAIGVAIVRLPDRAAEFADARLRGLAPGVHDDPADVDAHVVKLIDAVLAAEHRGTLELEVEGAVPMDAALAVHLAGLRGAFAPVSVVVAEGDGPEAAERFARLGAAVRMRVGLVPSGALRPAARYLHARVAEREAGLLRDEDLVEPSADGTSPIESRLLDAAQRAATVASGPRRPQHRVNPEDAPGVTASIPFELFPPGLFADEPESPRPDWSQSFVAAAPIVVADAGAGEFADDETTVLGRRGRRAAGRPDAPAGAEGAGRAAGAASGEPAAATPADDAADAPRTTADGAGAGAAGAGPADEATASGPADEATASGA
ncbi:MAG: hypothetical protein GXX90_03730, partial [Microbacteriaceae bacterium]|nr:hypothetical protein [Microbacteriaceae bacterium]